jgi:hypothetical protein
MIALEPNPVSCSSRGYFVLLGCFVSRRLLYYQMSSLNNGSGISRKVKLKVSLKLPLAENTAKYNRYS